MNKNITISMCLAPSIGEIRGSEVAGTERMFLKDLTMLSRVFSTRTYARFAYSQITPIFFPRTLLRMGKFLHTHLGKYTHPVVHGLSFTADVVYCFFFFVRSFRSDVVLAYSFPLLGIFQPKKTVNLVHFVPTLYFPQLFRKRYEAMHWVFCSKFLRKEFTTTYPQLHLKSTVMYNSIDTLHFRPTSSPKHKAQHTHTARQRKVRLLFASAWIPEKGLHLLLEALQDLPPHIQRSFQLTISSSPQLWFQEFPDENQKYIEHILSLIKNTKQVRLLQGVSYQKMPALYRSHDYVIFPSDWNEPFGLVVLEALACGTPVISSLRGALPEILSPQNCISIKPITSKGLQTTLIKAYKQHQTRHRRSGSSLLTKKNKNMVDDQREKIFHKFLKSLVLNLYT